MTRRTRWTTRSLVLALAAAMCSACVSIPDSSPVREADDVNVEGPSQPISNVVPGPRPGDTPASIVRGFIGAMLAYPQSTATAREFLAPAAELSWDPGERVVVYDDLGDFDESDEGITVTVEALGSLDSRGSWTTVPPSRQTETYQFRMEQVEGEWRIANPPAGILIDDDFFARNYQQFALYFLDPTRTVVTPDPVYLLRGDTAATALVADLLGGPTPDLTRAVSTAAPVGTEVDPAVSLSASGVAEVPLTPQILKLGQTDRDLFAAQLAWTLSQLPEVSAVTMTVDGAPLSVAVGDQFAVDDFGDFDPAGPGGDEPLVALSRQGLVSVGPSEATAVGGPIGSVPAGRSVAVDPLAALAAIVRADGHSVVVGGIPSESDVDPRTWIEGRTNLLKPSWDPHGVLWVVDRNGGDARILAATAEGVRTVPADGLAGRDVIAFAVSRDGVRAAAIVRDRAGRAHLMLATIDRSAQQPARVMLGPAREVVTAQVTLQTMTRLAWASPTVLAVLGRVPSGDARPYEVAIDGSQISEAAVILPTTPISLAASPTQDVPLVIGNAERRLYLFTADRWLPVGGTVRLKAPTYPG